MDSFSLYLQNLTPPADPATGVTGIDSGLSVQQPQKDMLEGVQPPPDVNVTDEELASSGIQNRKTIEQELFGALPVPEIDRRIQFNREMNRAGPKAQEFVSRNPALHHDVVNDLSWMENIYNGFKGGAISSVIRREVGTQIFDGQGEAFLRTKQVQKWLELEKEYAINDSGVGWALGTVAQMVGQIASTLGQAETYAAIGAGAGAGAVVGGGVGAAAGAGIGVRGAFAADSMVQNAAEVMIALQEEGVPYEEAREWAIGAGIISGALDAATFGVKIKPLSDLKNNLIRRGIADVAKERALATAFRRVGKQVLKSAGSETLTETTQTAVQIAAQEMAKHFAEGDYEAMSWDEIREQLWDAARSAAIGAGGIGSVAGGASAISNLTKARNDHALLTNIQKIAKKGRSQAEFAVEQLRQNGVNLHLDPDAAQQIVAQDPEAAQKLGINQSTLDRHNETGEAIPINPDTTLALLEDDTLFAQVVDYLSTQRDGMTFAQTEEMREELEAAQDVSLEEAVDFQGETLPPTELAPAKATKIGFGGGNYEYRGVRMTKQNKQWVVDGTKLAADSRQELMELIDGEAYAKADRQRQHKRSLKTVMSEEEMDMQDLEDAMALDSMFESAGDANMTENEWATYQAQRESSRTTSHRTKAARKVRRMKEAVSLEIKKSWEFEADAYRQRLMDTPAGQFLMAFMDGKAGRIDRNQLLQYLAPSELALLPKGKNGQHIYVDPDKSHEPTLDLHVLAELNGNMSPKEMVEQLVSLGQELRPEAFNNRIDNIMAEKHAELFGEEAEWNERLQALKEANGTEHLVRELGAIKGTFSALGVKQRHAIILEGVARTLMGTPVSDIRSDRFRNKAAQWGRLAYKAWRNGDRENAYKYKYRQIVNTELAIMADRTRANVASHRKLYTKYGRSNGVFPNMEAEHVDAIRAIVDGLGLYGPKRLDRTLPMPTDAQLQELADKWTTDRVFPHSILTEIQRTPLSALTYGQEEALYRTIKQIEKAGRNAKTIKLADREEDRLQVKDQIMINLQKMKNIIGGVDRFGEKNKTAQAARTVWSSLDKAENILMDIDGGTAGAAHAAIYQPMADSDHALHELERKVFPPLVKQLKQIAKKKRLRQKVFVKGLNQEITIDKAIVITLNSGNASNLDKMIRGEKFAGGKDKDAGMKVVEEIRALLTDDEMAMIQQLWDTMENDLFPKVKQIWRENKGVEPKSIPAVDFEHNGKTYRGGYWPMMYDEARRTDGLQEQKSVFDMLQNRHEQGMVFHGFVHERNEGYSAPIVLDLNRIPSALHNVMHMTTHFDAVMNVKKMLYDPDIKEEMLKKIGAGGYKALDAWLQDVASNNQNLSQVAGVEMVLNWFTRATTAAAMVGSMSTILVQSLGLTATAARLGTYGTAKYLVPSLMHAWRPMPDQRRAFAFKHSKELRYRDTNYNQAVTENFRASMSGGGFRVNQVNAIGFRAIGMFQVYVVDVATWDAFYRKAISEGKSQEAAVNEADAWLRRTQGSGSLKDQNALQRSKWGKFLTMFNTFFIQQTAEHKSSLNQVRNGNMNLARFVEFMMVSTLLTVTLEGLLKDSIPDDEWEDEGDAMAWGLGESLMFGLQGIPFVREGAKSVNAIMQGDELSTALRGITPIAYPVEALGKALDAAVYLLLEEDSEMTLLEVGDIMAGIMTSFALGGGIPLNRVTEAAYMEYEDWRAYVFGPKEYYE